MKQQLIRRFQYLWTLELLNAVVVFPGFVLLMGRIYIIGPFVLLATGLVCFLLVVGTVFAWLKVRDLRDDTQRLRGYEGVFRGLRRVVPWLIVAVLGVGIVQFAALPSPEHLFGWGLGLLLLILALLEYVNYFHTQLMYDNRRDLAHLFRTRRLKRGLIAREFGWG